MKNSMGRLFNRYKSINFGLKLYPLNSIFPVSTTKIYLVDLSFSGCRIISNQELLDGDYILEVGSHRLKFNLRFVWEITRNSNHIYGAKVRFNEKKSFTYWTKLIQSIDHNIRKKAHFSASERSL